MISTATRTSRISRPVVSRPRGPTKSSRHRGGGAVSVDTVCVTDRRLSGAGEGTSGAPSLPGSPRPRSWAVRSGRRHDRDDVVARNVGSLRRSWIPALPGPPVGDLLLRRDDRRVPDLRADLRRGAADLVHLA